MSRRAGLWAFIAAGFLIALLLAFLVAPHASSSPDGLAKVSADKGLDGGVSDHAAASGPLADHAVRGIGNNNLSIGVAGVIGVTVVFATAFGLSKVTRATRSRTAPENAA